MARGTFYTTEKIGPKQSFTPEGFLLCEEVAIARSGMMIYGPDETPIAPGPDGITKIFREDEDVFRPETVASAQGKSVTNDHPEDDVKPDNWKELTHGIVMNVRRGEGAMDDLMLGDFLITTPEGIKAIQEGKREVSLGYEADYEEVEQGVGKQSNLIINHVALVEQGRCGPRCAISDSKPNLAEVNMKVARIKQSDRAIRRKQNKFLDALRRAFKAKDEETLEDIAEELVEDEDFENVGNLPAEEDTHIHIHSDDMDEEGEAAYGRAKFTDDDIQQHMDQNAAEHAEFASKIAALEAAISKLSGQESEEPWHDEGIAEEIMDEMPEGLEKEEVKSTKDSRYFSDSFRDTVALAEILAPGIRVPTFDSASKPSITFKKICGLRRQALDVAYAQPATRGTIDELLSGKTLDTSKMTCDAIRTLFKSAAALQRTFNNSPRMTASDAGQTKAAGPLTLAELNARNKARYGG